MARQVLQKIKPFHPPEAFKPPKAAEAAGVTPDGKQLFRRTVQCVRAVPRYATTPEAVKRLAELEAQGASATEIAQTMNREGLRQYRKNQMTGELAYPLNRAEQYMEERTFYVESQGNGNNTLVSYSPPTPEQLAAEGRRRKVAALGGGRLAEVLVDQDITPEELAAVIKGRRGVPEPVFAGLPEITVEDDAGFIDEGDSPVGAVTPADMEVEPESDEDEPVKKHKRGRWPTRAEKRGR